MPAPDTNVLVRYVVEDDAAQLAAAKRLISRCVGEGLALFVPVTVVLEFEWVLRSNFAFPKDDVLLTLSSLLSASELVSNRSGRSRSHCSCFARARLISRTVCTSR
jgi:predicted nucleic-acid-binding protein